jgi:hypothetical protein
MLVGRNGYLEKGLKSSHFGTGLIPIFIGSQISVSASDDLAKYLKASIPSSHVSQWNRRAEVWAMRDKLQNIGKESG